MFNMITDLCLSLCSATLVLGVIPYRSTSVASDIVPQNYSPRSNEYRSTSFASDIAPQNHSPPSNEYSIEDLHTDMELLQTLWLRWYRSYPLANFFLIFCCFSTKLDQSYKGDDFQISKDLISKIAQHFFPYIHDPRNQFFDQIFDGTISDVNCCVSWLKSILNQAIPDELSTVLFEFRSRIVTMLSYLLPPSDSLTVITYLLEMQSWKENYTDCDIMTTLFRDFIAPIQGSKLLPVLRDHFVYKVLNYPGLDLFWFSPQSKMRKIWNELLSKFGDLTFAHSAWSHLSPLNFCKAFTPFFLRECKHDEESVLKAISLLESNPEKCQIYTDYLIVEMLKIMEDFKIGDLIWLSNPEWSSSTSLAPLCLRWPSSSVWWGTDLVPCSDACSIPNDNLAESSAALLDTLKHDSSPIVNVSTTLSIL